MGFIQDYVGFLHELRATLEAAQAACGADSENQPPRYPDLLKKLYQMREDLGTFCRSRDATVIPECFQGSLDSTKEQMSVFRKIYEKNKNSSEIPSILQRWQKRVSQDLLNLHSKLPQLEWPEIVELLGQDELHAYSNAVCSPYVRLHGSAQTASGQIEHAETYFRSAKYYLWGGRSPDLFETGPYVDLKYGDSAHFGNVRGPLEVFGKKEKPVPGVSISSSSGDSQLYEALLAFKLQILSFAVAKLRGLKCLTVGVYHDYPCLMVAVSPKTALGSPTKAAFNAWVHFLISCLVGLVNSIAAQRGFSVELVRRSSFGFVTPTVAPVGEGMRIELGLVPQEYVQILIEAVRKLDAGLVLLLSEPKRYCPLPDGFFYGSEQHRNYLGKKYPPEAVSSVLQALWKPVEKAGKTGWQNWERSAAARLGVVREVFNNVTRLGHAPEVAIGQALCWMGKRFCIKGEKLTFSQPSLRELQDTALEGGSVVVSDTAFWGLIQRIYESVNNQLNEPFFDKLIVALFICWKQKIFKQVHPLLELLNQMIWVYVVRSRDQFPLGDGYGSDSEDEEELGGVRVFHKKVITQNGMRAIWAAVGAVGRYLAEQSQRTRLYLGEGTYYEVNPKTVEGFKGLEDIQITRVNRIEEANVVVGDLTACQVQPVGGCSFSRGGVSNRILIIDTTSASSDKVAKLIVDFAAARLAALILVDSGLKQQQMGADVNPYGTVRILARNDQVRAKLRELFCKHEPPVASSVAHGLRRTYKRIGCVPTARRLLETSQRLARAENAKDERQSRTAMRP